MNEKEFAEYLDRNSNVRDKFSEKAMDYQIQLNDERAFARQWNEAEINRAVDKMYQQFLDSVYEKVQSGVDTAHRDDEQAWINFMDSNDILDSLEDSTSELEFG